MDIWAIKKEYGSDLTLFGGIGTQVELTQSSPLKIKSHVHAVCRSFGTGGGFILAPGIGLNYSVPVENAMAFIDAAMNQDE
jgi:uroporphyrinogen-III decarboxylase